MGENRLFWPQELMDEWIFDEKASIENNVLTIIDETIQYRLAQAVHFVKDVGDGTDTHNLIGKVKELNLLEAMNSEHYMDSVIIDDSAYQVVQGFSGTPVAQARPELKPSAAGVPTAGITSENEDENEERELLASFLLNNL